MVSSSTIKFSAPERATLDRLRRKYGTVRNTVINGIKALDRVERGELVPRKATHTTEESAGTDARSFRRP